MLKYALQLYLSFLVNVRKCVIKVSTVFFSVYSAQGYFSLRVCFAQPKSLNNSLNISKYERHTLPVILHPKTRHNLNAKTQAFAGNDARRYRFPIRA